MLMARTAAQRIANAANARARYQENLEDSRARGRAAADRRRQKHIPRVVAVKMERGCIDCGYRAHPAALHFDHRDPSTKLFAIAKGLTRSWAAIEAEIAKCDVRCANCHAIRGVVEGHLGRPRIEALV